MNDFDTDNHAWYGFVAAIVIGIPGSLYQDDPNFMPVAWVIGVIIFGLKKWVIG